MKNHAGKKHPMEGVYSLKILVAKACRISIGALGTVDFEKGIYLYIGSAQNNLEKRIKRHKNAEKKIHWHIDYLLSGKYAGIEKVFYKPADKPEECRIARTLALSAEPVNGFGCSDCSCKSHLFRAYSEDVLYAVGMKVWKKNH